MRNAVQDIFSEVPKTYELVNHVLTLGMDILWRRKTVKTAIKTGGTRWLDVCTGTGETAAYLKHYAGKDTKVYAADFSLPMLRAAKKKKSCGDIEFSLSDIKKLPFRNNTFDLITISFATRNININRKALAESFKELYRILRPGGNFINLETSQPSSPTIKKLFHLYIKLFIKPVGRLISGSKDGYAYLSNTIPRFYPAEELAEIIKQSGFKKVSFTKLFPGTAAIHKCTK
ncbi:MAG TPA: ubiquinone/menaquinone biosynthesis methyltransferase [Candidatus Omnitrophica bacterium]|nr:ubiquinone/menaquinone biosynthesis methyltransferase [Candidatus Omnitrophota bacterium]